ncbi:hypothetical protein TPE_1470 [Treponema pedis str. T A4]|uniref:Uncharacterized protein n=1 Tax=Treponema pedis str. T A4 TaxID=1291379 RepID=S5ZUT6_9SPIR|nr:hypothetical protein TPE_1470 [Treponema pedis str. T A4]
MQNKPYKLRIRFKAPLFFGDFLCKTPLFAGIFVFYLTKS